MDGGADLLTLSLAEARDGLRAKRFSARELTLACLDAIANASALNCLITDTAEQAMIMADAADRRLAKGDAGPLEGIPIGVKDLFCTKDVLTTAASHILDGFKPPYESTVTSNLWRDGAVMMGKLNLDEFAMGSSNETSYYGPAVNPWRRKDDDAKLVPGGSSGGSASAVAASLMPAAIGTDTGGSIRQPAAFTATVGMKPTYGLCSRWGIVAFASSLDQAGPVTRTVKDAAILLTSMAGYDAMDSTSLKTDIPDYTQSLTKGAKGLRVGIPNEYRVDGMPEEIERLWQDGIEWYRQAGAEIIEVSLPHTKYALPTYYIIAPAEASSNLARYDGVKYGLRVEADDIIGHYEQTRAEGFGDEVKRRILIGTYVLSAGYYDAYYLKAQRVRNLIAADFKSVFEKVDVLLTPTTPFAAFGLGEKSNDPIAMYLNDIFTVTASLAGLPAISVPAGVDEAGLPLGLQVIAKTLDEETMFRAARILEEAAHFTIAPRPWWN